MRFDKLTTKFQQAFATPRASRSATTTASSSRSTCWPRCWRRRTAARRRCSRAPACRCRELQAALKASIDRLPKVEGTGGEITISRDLNNLLNLTDKEATKRGDQFIASELFLLALSDDKGDTGRLLKDAGLTRKALESAIEAVRGGAGVDSAGRRGPARRRSTSTRSTSPSAPATASSTR